MRDYRDAKAMATSLRQALTTRSVSLTHSDALELIARSFGLDNWNILAAKIDETAAPASAPQADLAAATDSRPALCCSFCGKSQYEVAKLIAGPHSFICNACVGLCVAIIDETDIHSLMQNDRAAGASDYPGLTASLRARSREQLDKLKTDTETWIAHVRWSLQEIARALGEPVTTALEPPSGRTSKPPLAGKSRDEILAMRADFERRLEDSRTALEIAARVRAEAEAG